MIDYAYRELFHESSIDKQWIITDGEITLTNEDIYSEEISIDESLCSDNHIVFGSCEASMLFFTTSCLTKMLGRRITVSMILEGNDDEPFVLGTYTVISDELTADRQKRKIEAYDDLYFINNANVAEWYNELVFPMNLHTFRSLFFTHFGITQETTTLPNDSMNLEKTIEAETLSGATVLQSICELNGRCGHIDRQGVFRYLPVYIGGKGLYPALTLYPNYRLFPSKVAEGGIVTPLPIDEYESIEYADYTVKAIDKLQIRQEENDIGAIVGTGDNSYIVEDNFLVYGKDATTLETIATNMFNEINKTSYTPISLKCIADPCVEVGDVVKIYTLNGTILYSYIMKRHISGVQNLKDEITSEGDEYQLEQVNSLNTEIIQLKGKTTKIDKNVEGISVIVEEDIMNPENPSSLASKISQNSTAIEAKVDETYGDSTSSFSWVLRSTGFDIKNSGNSVFKVNASGAEINGKVTAKNGYIGNGSNGFTIGDTAIYNGVTAMTDNTNNGIYIGTDGIKLAGQNEWMELRAGTAKSLLYGDYFQLENNTDGYIMKIDNSWINCTKQSSSSTFEDQFYIGDYYGHGYPVLGVHKKVSGVDYWATLDGESLYVRDAIINRNCGVYGNLTVYGSKDRGVKTEHYGTRLLGAYETPEPYFGDIGESLLDSDGRCIIEIDKVFLETINTKIPYQVFLQAYGDGKCWVEERNETNFVVKGTPNMKFGYEIKAKQLGFENRRLAEMEER